MTLMFIVHFSNGSKLEVEATCREVARMIACRRERVFSVIDVEPVNA